MLRCKTSYILKSTYIHIYIIITIIIMSGVTETPQSQEENQQENQEENQQQQAEKLEVKQEDVYRNQQLSVFNKNLLQLLQDLNENFADYKINIAQNFGGIVNNPNTYNECCAFYMERVNGECFLLSEKSEELFNESREWFPTLDISIYWNNTQSEEIRSTLWQYLHTLFIYGYNYTHSVSNIKEYCSSIKKEELNDETKAYIRILQNLSSNKSVNKIMTENISLNNTNTDTNTNQSQNNLPDLGGLTDSLFGGSIGKLAQEIAESINPEELNLENPADLLSGLLGGGGLPQNNGFMKLVEKIGSNVQSKIDDGSLNEEELLSNAQGLMGQMNNENSPMLSMFKQMSSMFGSMGGDLGNMSASKAKNMAKNMNLGMRPGELQKSVRRNSTRDRLRKKLEMKKQQQQQLSQQQLLQQQLLQQQLLQQQLSQQQAQQQAQHSHQPIELEPQTKTKKKRRRRRKNKKKTNSVNEQQTN